MTEKQISTREREILLQAAEGRTDKEIAALLGLSLATVRTYWERLRAKTETTNRSEAIMKVLGGELRSVAEEAIRARAERDLLLSEAEGFCVFDISLKGMIMDWNPGVFRLLGYLENEFVRHPFAVVFTPEDAKNGEPEFEMKEAIEHGRCLERRYHQRKDGTHIWIDGTLIAHRDSAGHVIKFSKIMRDDSERKSMEEELQRLQARSRLPS